MTKFYPNVAYLERRIVSIYGMESNALRALDLIKDEMCFEKGFKRDDDSDYYTHCVDVANTLLSYGIKDEDVICAALLHDIIEDVEGYKEITLVKLFNNNIARLVSIVTKTHGVDYHNPENLKLYIDTISQDQDASAIKTADRMHNMMTLNNKTFKSRYEKAIETKKYYLPFFTYCRRTYPRYENLFFAAQSLTEPLIFTIEAFYNEICYQEKIIKGPDGDAF